MTENYVSFFKVIKDQFTIFLSVCRQILGVYIFNLLYFLILYKLLFSFLTEVGVIPNAKV